MLTLHFALLAVLVISDLTFIIALVVLYPCQIAMCRLHFAISIDKISLNSFHGCCLHWLCWSCGHWPSEGLTLFAPPLDHLDCHSLIWDISLWWFAFKIGGWIHWVHTLLPWTWVVPWLHMAIWWTILSFAILDHVAFAKMHLDLWSSDCTLYFVCIWVDIEDMVCTKPPDVLDLVLPIQLVFPFCIHYFKWMQSECLTWP